MKTMHAAFASALIIVASFSAARADQGAQVFPPENPAECESASLVPGVIGALTWDGVNSVRCQSVLTTSSTGNVGIGGVTTPNALDITGPVDENNIVDAAALQRSENYAVGNSNDWRNYLAFDSGFMSISSSRAGVPISAAYILSELTSAPTNVSAPPFPLDIGTGSSFDGTAGSQIGFVTLSTERMRIAANGNVGIGTTGPGARLSIVGGSADEEIFVRGAKPRARGCSMARASRRHRLKCAVLAA